VPPEGNEKKHKDCYDSRFKQGTSGIKARDLKQPVSYHFTNPNIALPLQQFLTQ
jgi:hypothetical protein